MTNLARVLKSRHHIANKDLYSKGYGFSVVMYTCKSWTIKKAELLTLLNCGAGEDS